jgi:hypothetical protein
VKECYNDSTEIFDTYINFYSDSIYCGKCDTIKINWFWYTKGNGYAYINRGKEIKEKTGCKHKQPDPVEFLNGLEGGRK